MTTTQQLLWIVKDLRKTLFRIWNCGEGADYKIDAASALRQTEHVQELAADISDSIAYYKEQLRQTQEDSRRIEKILKVLQS